MATWAMRQRYAWIEQRLAAGESFTRQDISDAFTVTKQTASATLREFDALHPDAVRYDAARKAFVRADQAPCRKGMSRAERILLDALQRIEAAPAWGAPDRWETTPAEVRQIARKAIAEALGTATASPAERPVTDPGTTTEKAPQ